MTFSGVIVLAAVVILSLAVALSYSAGYVRTTTWFRRRQARKRWDAIETEAAKGGRMF